MQPDFECPPMEIEDENANQLFNEMNRLRRIWLSFHRPEFPVRRSEMELLHAVMILSNKGERPVTVGQLARHTHQSMPGISQKLSELEKQDLIRRMPGQSDRRQVMVELTAKGVETFEGPLRDFFGQIGQALNDMGQAKTCQLIQLVHDLCESMQNVM